MRETHHIGKVALRDYVGLRGLTASEAIESVSFRTLNSRCAMWNERLRYNKARGRCIYLAHFFRSGSNSKVYVVIRPNLRWETDFADTAYKLQHATDLCLGAATTLHQHPTAQHFTQAFQAFPEIPSNEHYSEHFFEIGFGYRWRCSHILPSSFVPPTSSDIQPWWIIMIIIIVERSPYVIIAETYMTLDKPSMIRIAPKG